MNFREKIISWDDLPAWRFAMRQAHKQVVVTNGCFDILHAGHVHYLASARELGDALLVGVNSDQAVRQLKGANRPVNVQEDRMILLAGLESVSGVCVFNSIRATDFLEIARPDIYVKGGDYTVETLNQEERRAVEKDGARIVIIPFVRGKSTTAVLQKILTL